MANKINNFKIPSQWLKRGEKIRLPHWQEESYWVLSHDGYGRILYSDKSPAIVHLEQLQNTEWEIVEKDLSLTDLQVKGIIKLLQMCPNKISTESIIKVLRQ